MFVKENWLCQIIKKWIAKMQRHSRHLPALNCNRNTRTRCEICSKLTIMTPERRQWRRYGVFTVNFEHISHLVLVFILFTLKMQLLPGELSLQTKPLLVDSIWKKCSELNISKLYCPLESLCVLKNLRNFQLSVQELVIYFTLWCLSRLQCICMQVTGHLAPKFIFSPKMKRN